MDFSAYEQMKQAIFADQVMATIRALDETDEVEYN